MDIIYRRLRFNPYQVNRFPRCALVAMCTGCAEETVDLRHIILNVLSNSIQILSKNVKIEEKDKADDICLPTTGLIGEVLTKT